MIEIGNCALIVKNGDGQFDSGQFDSVYDIKKFFESDNKNLLILTNVESSYFSNYPSEYVGVKNINKSNYKKIIKENIYNIDIILLFLNKNITFLKEIKNYIESIKYKSIFVIKDSTYSDYKDKIEYLKFSNIYEISSKYKESQTPSYSFNGNIADFKKENMIKDVINNWESSTEALILMKIRDIKINNIIDKQ